MSTAQAVTKNTPRRLPALALIAALALAPVVASGERAEANTPDPCSTSLTANPDSWSDNPRPIANKDELVWLSLNDEYNGAGNWDKNYILTAEEEIDLQGCIWTPIGDYTTRFTGNFDGGHKTISNLTIRGSFDAYGFFGVLAQEDKGSKGNISNVRLVEVDIDVQGTWSDVGGIAGDGAGGSIRNSFVSGSISGGDNSAVGGLVGRFEGQMEASFSSANVEGTGSPVGGLIGLFTTFAPNPADNPAPRVRDSYATGDVRGADVVGGLIGFQSQTGGDGVANSYSTGLVTSSEPSPSNLGGSFGTINKPAPGVYWQTDGQENLASAGGFAAAVSSLEDSKIERATTTELQTLSTFTSGDSPWDIVASESFDAPNPSGPGGDGNIWGIGADVNCGYPFLWWQTVSAHECTSDESATPAIPAPAPTGSSSSSGPDASATPGIHLDVQASVGSPVAGASVVIGGQGLQPGSAYSLVVRSNPITVTSGVASGTGSFSQRVTLPAGIAPGNHTITLRATGSDGSALVLTQSFTVAADGTFSALGAVTGSTTGGLAVTGVNGPLGLGMMSLAALMVFVGAGLILARRRAEVVSS